MNRFGSNYYEDENEQFAENHRVGRQLADNAEKNWQASYPNEGYATRSHSHPPYRSDRPSGNVYGYLPPHTEQNDREYYVNQQNPYDPSDSGRRHHDTSIWTERNFYKDTDYRYRSGHRDQWHRDYDREYDPEWRGDRRQPHEENFFNRIGDGIREGWHNLFHHDEDRERYERERRQERERGDQDRRDNRRYGPERDRNSGYSQRSSEWKNSGPDYRDEDFLHPTDPRY